MNIVFNAGPPSNPPLMGRAGPTRGYLDGPAGRVRIPGYWLVPLLVVGGASGVCERSCPNDGSGLHPVRPTSSQPLCMAPCSDCVSDPPQPVRPSQFEAAPEWPKDESGLQPVLPTSEQPPSCEVAPPCDGTVVVWPKLALAIPRIAAADNAAISFAIFSSTYAMRCEDNEVLRQEVPRQCKLLSSNRFVSLDQHQYRNIK